MLINADGPSSPVTSAFGLTRSPPDRHDCVPARIALSAAQQPWFKIEQSGSPPPSAT